MKNRNRIAGLIVAIVVVFGSAAAEPAGKTSKFSDQLWQENLDVYQAILKHPFLRGLTDGTLNREAFSFYIIQDSHYLREFARALAITASKAPRQDWAALLSTHASDTSKYERKLHESIFQEYGISADTVAGTQPSPEAFGYTNFLVATAYSRSFEESMAALLPCYWVYWEVGKELKKRGSKNPIYQKWIDAYSSEEYGAAVRAVLEIINEVTRGASPATLAPLRENFRRGARYEWMFWNAAYRRSTWPPGK